MKTTGNTVLITGGSAGIGLETARLLLQHNNKVIITGRNAERLAAAARELQGITTFTGDVDNEADTDRLVNMLQEQFPTLNMLINNAGRASVYNLADGAGAAAKATAEMQTNFLSVMGLTEKLLPLLDRQPEAAIVNVSSILALVPYIGTPSYSASKAALHSYTQSLRLSLHSRKQFRVFELMPPLVNTDFSREIGGSKGIPPQEVAADLLRALEQDTFEIHVGNTVHMYELVKASPADALDVMNNR